MAPSAELKIAPRIGPFGQHERSSGKVELLRVVGNGVEHVSLVIRPGKEQVTCRRPSRIGHLRETLEDSGPPGRRVDVHRAADAATRGPCEQPISGQWREVAHAGVDSRLVQWNDAGERRAVGGDVQELGGWLPESWPPQQGDDSIVRQPDQSMADVVQRLLVLGEADRARIVFDLHLVEECPLSRFLDANRKSHPSAVGGESVSVTGQSIRPGHDHRFVALDRVKVELAGDPLALDRPSEDGVRDVPAVRRDLMGVGSSVLFGNRDAETNDPPGGIVTARRRQEVPDRHAGDNTEA